MDWNDNDVLDQEKTKLLTKIGCFLGIVILGIFAILIPAWLYFSYPDETQLMVSHSPNNINTIEVVKTDDFPDPTIRIYYDDKHITKTKLPNDISVEWINDYEANVILKKQKREPEIVYIEFK
ncbi:hypothetical protein [Bacillus kwashiorkori]|uniref:hypothetical protein n=1 Tax=Bacillus kwashiorkori TaxID=1522318 RepID=UPI000780BA27|nr:hypothetical protein [Bacillus kwashiorkori]